MTTDRPTTRCSVRAPSFFPLATSWGSAAAAPAWPSDFKTRCCSTAFEPAGGAVEGWPAAAGATGGLTGIGASDIWPLTAVLMTNTASRMHLTKLPTLLWPRMLILKLVGRPLVAQDGFDHIGLFRRRGLMCRRTGGTA